MNNKPTTNREQIQTHTNKYFTKLLEFFSFFPKRKNNKKIYKQKHKQNIHQMCSNFKKHKTTCIHIEEKKKKNIK